MGAGGICFTQIWIETSEREAYQGTWAEKILVSGRTYPEISELTVNWIIPFCMAFDKTMMSRAGRNIPLQSTSYKESEDRTTKNTRESLFLIICLFLFFQSLTSLAQARNTINWNRKETCIITNTSVEHLWTLLHYWLFKLTFKRDTKFLHCPTVI